MYSTITAKEFTLELTFDYIFHNYIELDKSARIISKETGIGVKRVESIIRHYKLNIKGSRIKYRINENKIDIGNPIFCYYLGIVYTDGYIDRKNHRVSIRCRNKGSLNVFTLIKEYFEFTGNISVYKGKDNDLTISNKKLVNYLTHLGLTGTKQQYKQIKGLNCVNMFLRGVLDGDGNIHNGCFRITMKNKEMMTYITNLVNNYLNTEYKIKFVRDKYYELCLRKADSKELLDYIYSGYSEYRFDDKYQKYLDDIV